MTADRDATARPAPSQVSTVSVATMTTPTAVSGVVTLLAGFLADFFCIFFERDDLCLKSALHRQPAYGSLAAVFHFPSSTHGIACRPMGPMLRQASSADIASNVPLALFTNSQWTPTGDYPGVSQLNVGRQMTRLECSHESMSVITHTILHSSISIPGQEAVSLAPQLINIVIYVSFGHVLYICTPDTRKPDTKTKMTLVLTGTNERTYACTYAVAYAFSVRDYSH
jgi:hypothetical protein